VILSLFQNCPPLFLILRRLSCPVPHAHFFFRSSATYSSREMKLGSINWTVDDQYCLPQPIPIYTFYSKWLFSYFARGYCVVPRRLTFQLAELCDDRYISWCTPTHYFSLVTFKGPVLHVPDLEGCLQIFLNCLTAVCGVVNEN